MGIIRESFVIFKNWAEAINALPDEFQLETYKALVQYGINGEMPSELSPVVKAMLISFSVGMENSICKYNASIENGKKGGNPNFEKGKSNPYYGKKDNPEITEHNPALPTHNLNDNDNVNVNVNDNVNSISSNELINDARSEGVIFYLEILSDKLKDLEKENYELYACYGERLKDLFQKISFEKNIKIGNATFQTEKVLYDLLDIFRQSKKYTHDLIVNCFEIIDSKTEIKNKFKYSISVFHNKAIGL